MVVGLKKKKEKIFKESQYMVSHPETGSDSPIGSDRGRGRDSHSCLRLSLSIKMTLSQRIKQVGENAYLPELSKLHKIGVHA